MAGLPAILTLVERVFPSALPSVKKDKRWIELTAKTRSFWAGPRIARMHGPSAESVTQVSVNPMDQRFGVFGLNGCATR